MMSADRTVLYSGLSQDDWDAKPKFTKLISHGPHSDQRPPKTSSKSRLKAFLLIVFVLCVVALLLVIGFRLYEVPKKDFFNFWNSSADKYDSATNASTTGVTGVQVKPLQNEKKEPNQKSHHNEQLTTTSKVTATTSKPKQKPTPTRNSSIDTTKTETTQKPTTLVVHPTVVLKNNSKVPPVVGNNSSMNTHNNVSSGIKDVVKTNTSISKPKNYEEKMDTINSTINNSSLTNQHAGGLNNDKSTSNDTYSHTLLQLASKYFNSTNLTEVENRMQELVSSPTVQMVAIASGLIFVGLSLVVIGVACIATKKSKRRRRRERINASKGFEGNEKVVLLSEDVSEDEFVRA